MGYFPFFVDLQGKSGIVIGGGKVAARKIEKLLEFGPRLTVIAPGIGDEILRLAEVWKPEIGGSEKQKEKGLEAKNRQTASLAIIQREVREEDLTGADFVIAATDDGEVNAKVSACCREQRIPVNSVDDKENCTFFFPALVKDGPLTIGISTEGKSPVAAAWVRDKTASLLPQGLGKVIDLLGQIRPEVLAKGGEEPRRREIFENMFLYCMEGMEKSREKAEKQVTIEELRKRFLDGETEDFVACSGDGSGRKRLCGKEAYIYEKNQNRNKRKPPCPQTGGNGAGGIGDSGSKTNGTDAR